MVATPPMVSVPTYYDRTGQLWSAIRLVGLTLALLAMATSMLFAIIWIPRKLLGQMQSVRHLTVRAVPLLAVLIFVGILFVARGNVSHSHGISHRGDYCRFSLGGSDAAGRFRSGSRYATVCGSIILKLSSPLGRGGHTRSRDTWTADSLPVFNLQSKSERSAADVDHDVLSSAGRPALAPRLRGKAFAVTPRH